MWGNKPEQKPPSVPEPGRPAAPERPLAPVSAPAPSAGSARTEPSRFAQNLAVKGEITGREDLYIDGKMEGAIRLPESRVTVGPNGRVAAEVEAGEIIVEGRVSGNLHARTRIELRSSSVVTGNAVTERLLIHEGARFNGRIEMVRPGEARVPRSAAPAASRSNEAAPAPVLAKDSAS